MGKQILYTQNNSGGGTLDVSLLGLQGGTFVTRALAGNNRLGGQDINELLLQEILRVTCMIFRLTFIGN